MMNNNKILTVSYGTFSCTLEGFDDSFGTMKAIAEYFRDLASDDRYFGAEPPQPDAQMLAQIAQREVARKVQAHEKDGKIVLSALEIHSEAADDSDARPTPAAAVPVADAAQPLVGDAVADDPVAVSAQDEADAAPQKVEDVPAIEEVLPAPEIAENTYDDIEEENDIVPGQPDSEVEAFFADAAKPVDIAEPLEVREASPTGTNDISAKLQRIRAVVAQNHNTTDEGAYAEDQHAEARARDAGTEDEDADILAAMQNDSIAPVPQDDTAPAPQDDALQSGSEETAETADLVEDEAAGDNSAPAAASIRADDEDDVDAILQRLATATSADETAAREEGYDDEDLQGADTLNIFEDTIAAAEQEDQTEQGEADDTAAQKPLNARVIKVNRAELEAAIDEGKLEEYEDQPVSDEPEAASLDQIAPARSKRSSLTQEDEEELVRELASLENDTDLNEVDKTADSKTAKPQAETEKRDTLRSDRRADPARDDADRQTDVNRLLAEADHQMDEPESATRRNAFSHLRAAVASQKADVAMGAPETEDKSDNAYRSDLADVVRPRRPEAGGQRTARPDDQRRPAPLKLVAEQRIDIEAPRNEGPIRPRRVMAVQDPEPTNQDVDSFADYAEEMGAETLPQLLEAAASYMAFVEGRDQFSRPQLMTKVRQSGAQEDFSREDGLRSFGQLLRAGKISKIQGGRFTVSDDIGFQPPKRATG